VVALAVCGSYLNLQWRLHHSGWAC
jgi:hypothetical protein